VDIEGSSSLLCVLREGRGQQFRVRSDVRARLIDGLEKHHCDSACDRSGSAIHSLPRRRDEPHFHLRLVARRAV